MLDLIIDHVSSFYVERPPMQSHALRLVSLVCRKFAAPAQRALFRKLLNVESHVASRAKAYSFLRAIRSHPDLAAAVDDLSVLAEGVQRFMLKPSDQYSSAADQAIQPYEWQLEVLKLCQQANSATITMSTIEQAAALGEQLAVTRSVQSLTLSLGTPEEDPALVRAFVDAYGGSSAPSLAYLAVLPSYAGTASASPSASASDQEPARPYYSTRELVLGLHETGLEILSLYLPHDIRELRSLVLQLPAEGWNCGSLDGVLTNLSMNVLTSFAVTCQVHEQLISTERCEHVESGANGLVGLRLEPPLFSAFARIRTLKLIACYGMRVEYLADLAVVAGTTVEHIELHWTLWTATPADLESDPSAPSAFEAHLMRVLDRMPRLRHFDAGMLPFTRDSPHSNPRHAFQAWASARGLELVIEGCPHVEVWEEDESEEDESEEYESDKSDLWAEDRYGNRYYPDY